jgi:hypothetical protein
MIHSTLPHGGTTEASTSGLTETQLMKKGQWSSTKAMAHYLHHDDEAKQDAQMKRIKRRKRAARKRTFVGMDSAVLSEWKSRNPISA